MMARLAVFLLWLVHLLPYSWIVRLGYGLGDILYMVGKERRRIAAINLRLCFPAWSDARRKEVLRAHFRALGRSFVERGVFWWSSPERIRRLVRLEGEHWAGQGPVIWLVPHFVGLDAIGARISSEGMPIVSMYSRQKSAFFDQILYRARTRFGRAEIFPRQAGFKPILKGLQAGAAFYYLPDMDFGRQGTIFSPFFGVPAATVAALPRIAERTGAKVVPFIAVQEPWGYRGRLLPPWSGYPTGDLEADVAHMNQVIEKEVLAMPEQYYWVHKRFKTRPEGEPSPYDKAAS